MIKENQKTLYKTVAIGLMTALVFVVSKFISIPVPNGVFVSRIHLGNAMCLLAGLLFGGMNGGLAAGLGSAVFDLTDPVYLLSSPFTFVSKFAMGFFAGKINAGGKKRSVARTVTAAVVGQLVYVILYLLKSFVTLLLLGNPIQTALVGIGTNAVTSLINAAIGVAVAVPLYFALYATLKRTGFYSIITEKTESKGYFNPLTAALTVFAVIVTTIFTINLAAQTKLDAAEAKEKQQLEERISADEKQIQYLYDKLGIELPPDESSSQAEGQ